MGEIKRVATLIEGLQQVRRICDETLRDRGDPTAALKRIAPMLENVNGDLQALRAFAPGLGDVWDTLRAVSVLARESAEWQGQLGPGKGDEGLQPAFSSAGRVDAPLFDPDKGMADPDEQVDRDD